MLLATKCRIPRHAPCGLLLATFSIFAVADPLPVAEVIGRLQPEMSTEQHLISNADSLSIGQDFGHSAYTAFVNGGPAPSAGVTVSASLASGLLGSLTAAADANYTYYFRVVDPLLHEDVPVDVSFTFYYTAASTSGLDWNGEAMLRIGTNWAKCLHIGPYDQCAGDHLGAGSFVEPFWVSPNSWADTHMTVRATTSVVQGGQGADITLGIDPVITVDAAWLAAHPDSTAQVEFITVPAAVPEPATWAMMVCGLAFCAAGLRRRR